MLSESLCPFGLLSIRTVPQRVMLCPSDMSGAHQEKNQRSSFFGNRPTAGQISEIDLGLHIPVSPQLVLPKESLCERLW
jgi:hypothetical protein